MRFPDCGVQIHSKEKLFPLSDLCAAWLWNLDFFRIQTTCLLSPTNKRQLVIIHSLKNDHVLVFVGLSLRPNHCRCLPLSADAYIDNSEWDSLTTMSPNDHSKDGRETAFLLTPLSWLLLQTANGQCVASFPHNPANVWRCRIFSS